MAAAAMAVVTPVIRTGRLREAAECRVFPRGDITEADTVAADTGVAEDGIKGAPGHSLTPLATHSAARSRS